MPQPTPACFLADDDTYAEWRERKLAALPASVEELIVEVRDPRRLTDAEHAALLRRCRDANMAIYAGRTGDDPDRAIPRRLGERFGLRQLDHNPGADDDAITSIRVQSDRQHAGYIPYTTRPIAWHTDGYYNPPDRRIGAFILHCVQPAAEGGENALIDPELLYLRLRDQSPAHIAALTRPDVMTIPPNLVDGIEQRPACPGPVFLTGADGRLAMRYTDRRRNIEWRDDAATAEALVALRGQLAEPPTGQPGAQPAGSVLPRFTARLASGWGVLCNNVLHTRTAFRDDGAPRLLYRARYHERIAGS